ncbi:amino acid ABC transporter permease [soil metagenome]
MSASVLFDAPGPRTRARHRLYSALFAAVLVVVAYWVYRKLDDGGQFEAQIYERLFSSGVWREIGQGLVATLKAAAVAIVTSVVVGFLLAVGRLSDHAWVRWPATTIIQFFRAVPVLLLMIFFFAFLGSKTDMETSTRAFVSVVTALTLYNGSVLAEVFRAGINAVPRGQSEAAYAVGLRKSQVMTIILTPQAVRFMLPAIISQCVVVLKDTALGAAITYTELARSMRLIADYVGSNLMAYLLGALLFIIINSLLSALATYLERRLAARGSSSQTAAVEDALPAG